MRYQVVCMLAALSSSPLSASAQDQGSTPNQRQPQSEPAQEAPALQLELDAAGVGVVPSPARTGDGYTLKEMEKRAQRAKRGLGVSVVPLFAGGMMMIAGTVGTKCFVFSPPRSPEGLRPSAVRRRGSGGGWRRGDDCHRHPARRPEAKAAHLAGSGVLRGTTQSTVGPCPIATRVLRAA